MEYRLHMRASISGQLAEGATVGRVAEALAVSMKTVKKWRARWKAKGLEELPDESRSGRPPVFRIAQRYEVITLACDTPANDGHAEVPLWTCDMLPSWRSLAAEAGFQWLTN